MSKRGKICVGTGLLLLAAALLLAGHNMGSDARARLSANMALEQLKPGIRAHTGASLPALPSGGALEAYAPKHVPETDMPEQEIGAQEVGAQEVGEQEVRAQGEARIPDHILNPEMDMPEQEIEGRGYIGVLRIPALSLELPVIGEWSYPGLKSAPCRYTGSAYLDNMVVVAHNYFGHFGNLRNLSQGDEVAFTDVDGNVFRYEVVELETLSPFAVEEMTRGDWDLTLFTCTVGGQYRVTVRCGRTDRGA